MYIGINGMSERDRTKNIAERRKITTKTRSRMIIIILKKRKEKCFHYPKKKKE